MPISSETQELNRLIEWARRIVFFGGAGVSTASGIPDFRSTDGLYATTWNGRSPEEILEATFWVLHTEEFYDFYRSNMVFPDAEPNVVHRWLYELEKQDKLRAVITQNIDGLHRKAGNIRLYELHGSVNDNYCVDCEKSYGPDKIIGSAGVPRCDVCGGIVKPGIVLYGENPDKYTMIGASRELSNADLVIVAGTSLNVEPAASLLDCYTGANLVVINKEPTSVDDRARLVIRENVEDVIGTLYERCR